MMNCSSFNLLRRKWRSSIPREKTIVILALIFVILQLATFHNGKHENQYRGTDFWNPGKTLGVRTLYETPFARFQLHKVNAGKNIINDWLWYDEMDNVNILVQEAETGKFVIFRQSKYAIPGPPTLAVVGGLIEPGESALEAAKRELLEELKMQSNDWVAMGSYRAAVNRGGGYTFTFLAKNSSVVADQGLEVKGQADLERQDVVRCTEEELLQYVLDGKFGEIKWTATVALSLLRLRS